MERTFPERPQIGSPYNNKAEYTKGAEIDHFGKS